MLITNNTNVTYWFGPHTLPGNGTLTLDDTSDTSLYLTDDTVADAVNTLWQSGDISVSSAASPFPRPTGTPAVLHGDGSPQGKIYAGQGSLYLRRDNTGGATALFSKTSGVTYNTGWASITDPWSGFNQSLGLQFSTFPVHMATGSGALSTGTMIGAGTWLNAGNVLNGLVVNCVTSGTPTSAYYGLYYYNPNLNTTTRVALTSNIASSFATAAWVEGPFQVSSVNTPYTVPLSGLYYLAVLCVTGTMPQITYITGAGSQASQPFSSVYPYFTVGSLSSLPSTVTTPSQSTVMPWIGAY